MDKFKDFIYDKSDILIALAILLIAALVIAWRLGAIVEYPKELINENNHSTEYTEENPEDKPADKPEENKPADNPEDKPANTPLWSNGVLSKDITVTIPSVLSATEAIQGLVDAGLVESYSEYETLCLNAGIDNPESVPAATFTFKAGMNKTDIVKHVHGL